ncbi:hypothetical protein L1887_14609 [Cichorium endivia]|nr:hypothetical protein L1887_14609 [Cichorium endivia]
MQSSRNPSLRFLHHRLFLAKTKEFYRTTTTTIGFGILRSGEYVEPAEEVSIYMAFTPAEEAEMLERRVERENMLRRCELKIQEEEVEMRFGQCIKVPHTIINITYFVFNIKLHNIFDSQTAYKLIEEQEGGTKVPHDYISFVSLLADTHYCACASCLETKEVRVLLRKMNEKSLWYLAVCGSLYCRCFCISDNNFADWPPLPPIPEYLATDEGTEEEILAVVDVPLGNMGLIIGKKGASILAIKKACE